METTLSRDCPATIIPAGDPVVLTAGTSFFITQTLGGNVTGRTELGLVRIAAENAGAIAGYTPEVAPADGGAPAPFSEEAVWAALRTCFDPEIPVNIVDLGLVYDLAIDRNPDGSNTVEAKMTLTAQGCGMGPTIAEDARQKIAALPTVSAAKVHIVWDPIWTPQMISPAGRKALGLE